MSARAARRLLLGALAISVLLHLIGVRFVHWSVPAAQEPPESVTLIRISTIRMAPPKQKPVQPRHKRQPRVRSTPINIPKTNAVSHAKHPIKESPIALNARPAIIPSPQAATTPVHLATPSPIGGCLHSHAAAAVLTSPSPPDIPAQARRDTTAGVTQVRVQLNERGDVVDAAVASSSGNVQLDQIALTLAKASTYAPDVVACKKIAAIYMYRVRFDPATTNEVR